jgi:hypothetical protein
MKTINSTNRAYFTEGIKPNPRYFSTDSALQSVEELKFFLLAE